MKELNYILITLDSCRYDAFVEAKTPYFDALGETHRCYAHGDFTLPSHTAMFKGMLPCYQDERVPYLGYKNRVFKLNNPCLGGVSKGSFYLDGADIIDGFNQKGYRTIGSGAVRWFDPEISSSIDAIKHFQRYQFTGSCFKLAEQIEWLENQLNEVEGSFFLFCNVGETHMPYWNEDMGERYEKKDINDPVLCREKQILCIEYADRLMGNFLQRFDREETLIVVTGDHGDCWGEDGLWYHGFYHEKIMEVPVKINRNVVLPEKV